MDKHVSPPLAYHGVGYWLGGVAGTGATEMGDTICCIIFCMRYAVSGVSVSVCMMPFCEYLL